LKEIGSRCLAILDEGETIPPEIYVELICAKIRSLEFPGGLHLGGGLQDSALFLDDGSSSSRLQGNAFGKKVIPGGRQV
jgi:hypothetical protein